MELHELARGVVHVHQQDAAWRTLFEPLMIAAVDLNQLAHTVAAPSRLVDSIATPRVRQPQAVLRHPLAQRLRRHAEPMALDQLLSS